MTSEGGEGRLAARAARCAALACIYFVLAAATVRFTRFDGGVAFIWAAGGVLSGALVVAERRRWAELIGACAVAGIAATGLFGVGPVAAIPLTMVNLSEAVLGAWLLRRWHPGFEDLRSIGETGSLLLTTGVAAPFACAFAGASVVTRLTEVAFWPNWLAWFAGHALGTVIVAPMVILALRGGPGRWLREASDARRIEAALLLGVLAAVTTAVFAQVRLPLLFLPFLPMMIAVFRLGRFGATASLVLIGVIGSVLTVRGLGPIALIDGSIGLRAQFFQLYLATAVLMVLPAAGDLTRRKRDIEELQEQAALHRLILDRTSDVIMTLGLDGRIRYASPSAARVIGLAPDALVGTMPHALIHADDIAGVVAAHRAVLHDPDRTFTVEYRLVVAGRELGWFESHARATLDGEGRPSGAVVIVHDVSERKTAERHLIAAAMTDTLTGVANRRAFDDALAQRLGSAGLLHPAVLAMFDLDHFKSINDRHGHAAGDLVLRAFAGVLRGSVRGGDLVARVGGEEFAAIIEGDLDAGRIVCERIRSRLAALDTEIADGLTLRATVSIGIAPLPPRGTPADLFAAADAALYRAKAEGRNRLAVA